MTSEFDPAAIDDLRSWYVADPDGKLVDKLLETTGQSSAMIHGAGLAGDFYHSEVLKVGINSPGVNMDRRTDGSGRITEIILLDENMQPIEPDEPHVVG